MADQVVLTADARPGDGKGEARALRRNGRVPAIAYGSGLDATPVHVDEADLRHVLATDAGENVVIRMNIAGEDHLTMPREIYRHPVKRSVMHLDFVAIDRNRKVTVDIPLVVEGEVEGAVINQVLNVLAVEVLPLEVPDSIHVSVEGREIGDVLRAGDITLPDGVSLVDDAESTAVSISLPETEMPEETEETEEDEDATEVPATEEGGDEE